MLAGVVGHVDGVPHPLSGASVSENSDLDVRELISGSRRVFRAPVPYQTLNFSWRSDRNSLRHLRDLYTRRWGGAGHFWIVSPTMEEDGNILPMRWSVGHQLAHVLDGLGNPKVSGTSATIYGSSAWSYATAGGWAPSIQFIVEPGKPYWFGFSGSAKGLNSNNGIVVSGHRIGTAETSWEQLGVFRSSTVQATPVLTKAQSVNFDFIRVSISMPASTSGELTVNAMELSNIDYSTSEGGTIRPGSGLGAVQMTSVLDGNILSNKIDRMGYSADFTEVDV